MPQKQEPVLINDAVPEDALRGLVLAAGAGVRLRPLTPHLPKVLCPVANVALVDHALARMATVTDTVAVNLHHGADRIAAHLAGRAVHLSQEQPEALGTAGAIGHLRDWISGADLVVLNGDTWCPGSLSEVVRTWDRQRVRLLVAGGDTLQPRSKVAGVLLPWSYAAALQPTPSGLYEVLLGSLAAEGTLDVARWDGPCIDCGTPAAYLEANLTASGGRSVVGDGASVEGVIERSVIWDGAEVFPSEHLVDAIRTGTGVTVLVRG